MDLDSIQRLFFEAIRWPTGVRDFLENADEGTRRAFAQTFRQTAELSSVDRVSVYANSYFHRLLGALKEMLPRLAAVCGETAFHNLVTDYVLQCPSTSPDLRRYADRFPRFVGEHALGVAHPILAPLATLELALSDALDAPDGDPVRVERLLDFAPEAWPALRFELSPPTRLVVFAWDFDAIAQACEAGRGERVLSSPGPAPAVGQGGAAQEPLWLVGRRAHRGYARRLGAAEAEALVAIARGEAFGSVCDELGRRGARIDAPALVGYLRQWIDAEILCWARDPGTELRHG